MTPEQLLAHYGITLPSYLPGRHYTTCPECSRERSAAHRNSQCLGVTIEGDSARWGCSHCGMTGPKRGNGAAGSPLNAHIYRDVHGAPLFRKVRNSPGSLPRFWLEKWNGAEWEKGTKDVDTSTLYRADEIAKAIKNGREIACVEGEKDADRLWSLGVPATCNAHGASESGKAPKWTRKHSAQLKGADIVVFNDNDPAGYAHADATCKLSVDLARRTRRLDLKDAWPEIGKGDDVSDWLDRGGGSAEKLVALIAGAPDYQTRSGDAEKPPPGSTADSEIARLAQLSELAYEQARKMAADKLNVRASALDRMVNAARGKTGDDKQGQTIDLHEPEPWPEAVDGAKLLDDITAEIKRYVVIAEHCAHAVALWTVHTYLLDHFLISPRLCVCSPVHRCGKTTLLDVVARLALKTLSSANISAAAIFRVVEAYRPALLVDEADTFLPGAEELRGIINSGHRRGGQVIRTVGDDFEVRTFSTYSAVVIALIGTLPPTLHDRSIVIDLKRRLRGEKVESFRLDRTAALDDLAAKTARWAFDHAAEIKGADPKTPEGLINRAADNWRALLAIAEAAGGPWPERARETAALCCQVAGDDGGAQIETLLGDIRDAFNAEHPDKATPDDEITSSTLVGRLVGMEGHPWAEMGKSRKPITQNKLARMLKPLAIGPSLIGESRLSGYRRRQFAEGFERYLAQTPLRNLSTSHDQDIAKAYGNFATSHPEEKERFEKGAKPNSHNEMRGREVAKGGAGEKYETHVCAQCFGESDGTEQRCFIGDVEVWLHPECQRFYLNKGGQ